MGSLSLSLFIRHKEIDWRKEAMGALAGRDRRPEWTAGWYKKLWEGCGTAEAPEVASGLGTSRRRADGAVFHPHLNNLAFRRSAVFLVLLPRATRARVVMSCGLRHGGLDTIFATIQRPFHSDFPLS